MFIIIVQEEVMEFFINLIVGEQWEVLGFVKGLLLIYEEKSVDEDFIEVYNWEIDEILEEVKNGYFII